MKKLEKGYSLFELIIVMAIFSTFIMLTSNLILASFKNIAENNKRADRLSLFTTSNNLITDYLPFAQTPLLQAYNDRVEFLTYTSEGPRYVMIWGDCTQKPYRVRYAVTRPYINEIINPSFEIAVGSQGISPPNNLAYDRDGSGLWNIGVGADAGKKVPNATNNAIANVQYMMEAPQGWAPGVNGDPTKGTAVSRVRLPKISWQTNDYEGATKIDWPGAKAMQIEQPNFTPDSASYSTAPDANYPPDPATTTPRNSYVWAQSDVIAASQGETFIVGGYMQDLNVRDGSETEKPRLEWYWVQRGSDGKPFITSERSGVIIAKNSAGSYYSAKTQPAPQGTDGIVVRLSPGIYTRQDGALFDGIMVQQINGRLDLPASSAGLYIDGDVSSVTSSFYQIPLTGTDNSYKVGSWLGVPQASMSAVGSGPHHNLWPHAASIVPAPNTAWFSTEKKRTLLSANDLDCPNLFKYYNTAGSELAASNVTGRLQDTTRLEMKIPVFPKATTEPLSITLNGAHNMIKRTTASIASVTGVTNQSTPAFDYKGDKLTFLFQSSNSSTICKVTLNGAGTNPSVSTATSIWHRFSLQGNAGASASLTVARTSGTGNCSIKEVSAHYGL